MYSPKSIDFIVVGTLQYLMEMTATLKGIPATTHGDWSFRNEFQENEAFPRKIMRVNSCTLRLHQEAFETIRTRIEGEAA